MDLRSTESGESYLIIGAGVFGASTALELKQSKPWAKVTLVDRTPFPNPAAASYDLNKIIRADYRDVFYMDLALKALSAWQTNPLYKPHYHETGMIFAEDSGRGQAFLSNYEQLGITPEAHLVEVEAMRKQFPWFKEANWTGVKRAYYSPRSGWGDAVPALRGVIQAAIDLGVVYRECTIDKLLFHTALEGCHAGSHASMRCIGVQTNDGELLRASHVLLCTGASTAQLLADSAPEDASLQVGSRLVAAAALSSMIRVAPDKWHKYRGAPVFANLMAHTTGEAIPLTPDGYLKVNYEMSFTNVQHHLASQQTFSTPPDASRLSCWTTDFPDILKEEARKVLVNIYGPDLDGLELDSFRLCWDTITPTQDWIISPVGRCQGLFIATGGSFHAWKFLPVLGKEIIKMLDGTITVEKATRWAWTSHTEVSSGACPSYLPKRDLMDLAMPTQPKARV